MAVRSCSWQHRLATAIAGGALAVAGAVGAGGVASASPQPPAEPTIVGGEIVDTAPSWTVVLGEDETDMFCSGTLVASQWIISAGHCGKRVNVARIGSERTYSGGTLVDVESKSAAHPTYDMRLYKLESPVTNEPVRLARSSPASGTNVTIYGYGSLCSTGQGKECGVMSDELRYVDSVVTTDSKCSTGDPIKPDGEFCVNTDADGAVCHGDSGGPAVANDRLAGVVSRKTTLLPCGNGNTIFGDVSVVRTWINETIAG